KVLRARAQSRSAPPRQEPQATVSINSFTAPGPTVDDLTFTAGYGCSRKSLTRKRRPKPRPELEQWTFTLQRRSELRRRWRSTYLCRVIWQHVLHYRLGVLANVIPESYFPHFIVDHPAKGPSIASSGENALHTV